MEEEGMIEADQKVTKMRGIPSQNGFFCSGARFPAFVAGWGTGKTAAGIARIMGVCTEYPGNVALITRFEYTDLRDSTIKDFGRYTGLKVDSDKNCKLDNGSLIMFRHGSELSVLQNINLGCFLMEQGEEFETDEQFQMLRGRLRLECFPCHFGAVIANTNGHNWIWDLWKRPKVNRDKDFELYEANSFENEMHLPADTIADWHKLEFDKPRIFRQFIMNSWEDYGTDALWFGEQMSKARRDGRVRPDLPIDKTIQCFRVWDIGSVHLACWIAQLIGGHINNVHYYQQDDPSLGLPEAIKAVKLLPYNVAQDFCGPDIAKGRVNGKTIMNTYIVDEAAKLGIHLYPVEDVGLIDGIEATRSIFPLLQFHEVNCADGLLAIDNYKRQPKPSISTPDRREYADSEVHDWASHGGSALRYEAVAYRYGMIRGSSIHPVHPPEFETYHGTPYDDDINGVRELMKAK